MVQRSKLTELRAKTDRDLVILANRELDRAQAIALADRGASVSLVLAEAAYAGAKSLLPVIEASRERAVLAARLREVRAFLDQASKPLTLSAGAGFRGLY